MVWYMNYGLNYDLCGYNLLWKLDKYGIVIMIKYVKKKKIKIFSVLNYKIDINIWWICRVIIMVFSVV